MKNPSQLYNNISDTSPGFIHGEYQILLRVTILTEKEIRDNIGYISVGEKVKIIDDGDYWKYLFNKGKG